MNPAPHRLTPTTTRVTTQDGLSLALHHMPGDGPPVLLVHGLGANHKAFDLPGRAFARWLAAQGWDVWMPDLRGAGESERPRAGWTLDDYLNLDVPALVDRILAETGASEVRWVGHSLGGVMLFCLGIGSPELPIARGVTIASALDYRVGQTGFRKLLPLRPVIRRLGTIPFGRVTRALSPMMGKGRTRAERFNVHPPNVEPEIIRAIHRDCFGSIPASLLASLATMFEPRGLASEDGFRFLEHAWNYRLPTTLLAGTVDPQVSMAAVETTARLLDGAYVPFGQAHGHAEDYGHWDLIGGRRAHEEVWPVIDQALRDD